MMFGTQNVSCLLKYMCIFVLGIPEKGFYYHRSAVVVFTGCEVKVRLKACCDLRWFTIYAASEYCTQHMKLLTTLTGRSVCTFFSRITSCSWIREIQASGVTRIWCGWGRGKRGRRQYLLWDWISILSNQYILHRSNAHGGVQGSHTKDPSLHTHLRSPVFFCNSPSPTATRPLNIPTRNPSPRLTHASP